MKKETQSLGHVGAKEPDPFVAALFAFTAKMDSNLKSAERCNL